MKIGIDIDGTSLAATLLGHIDAGVALDVVESLTVQITFLADK